MNLTSVGCPGCRIRMNCWTGSVKLFCEVLFLTIQECISDFLIDQQVKGNSMVTVLDYSRFLSYFERFQSAKSQNMASVTVSDCRAYYCISAQRMLLR